jgi:hypothetical protein
MLTFKHNDLATELRPIVAILRLFLLILCLLSASGTVRAQAHNWKPVAIHGGTNWVNVSGSRQTNQATVPLNATNGVMFF